MAKAKAKSKKEIPAVYKIIEIVGTSTKSWNDAAQNGINAAAKSLRDLRVAEVKTLDAKIESGRLVYRCKLMVSFKYHGND